MGDEGIACGNHLRDNADMSSRDAAKFEDLHAWRSARALTKHVYAMTLSGPLSRDTSLATQLQRAAVSAMANIAEGYERGRPGELHQFVSIAKGSCAEVRSHLYAAFDAGYLDEEAFATAIAMSEESSRLIGGLRAWAERRRRQS
jgi:four helix bundle protein